MNGPLMRAARKAKNLTQQALADAVGTVQSVVAELENGTRKSASLGTLKGIARELEISLDDLTADPENSSDLPTAQPPDSVAISLHV